MTKDELIVKQQLHIERLTTQLKENKQLKKDLLGLFYNIGQPLNDNILQFNKDQLRWCIKVVESIECLTFTLK